MARSLVLFLAIALISCGGGGGGGDEIDGPLVGLRTIALTVRVGEQPDFVDRMELTAIDGGPSFNVQPAGFDAIADARWSPAHHRIALLAVDFATEFARLFVVDPATLIATEVSAGIPAAAKVWDYDWSPDSDRLVFTASEPGEPNQGWIVAPDGSGLDLRFTSWNSANSEGIEQLRWSPDGASVAWLDPSIDLDSPSLFLGDPETGFAFSLARPDDAAFEGVRSFEWSPDGLRIAFLGEMETAGAQEAFVVPISGAGPTARLHAALPGGREVSRLEWAPDGSRVALLGDLLADEKVELFTALPAGGTATPINGALVSGGDVQAFAWAPDSSLLAYVADQTTDELLQLFVRLPDGSGVALEISLGAQGSVSEFAWAPNSGLLAYAAGPLGGLEEVFVRPPAPQPGVKVSWTSLVAGGVRSLVWSPQSNRIAFRAEHLVFDRFDCFVATLAFESAVPLTDFSALADERSRAGMFGFDSSGARIIYAQGDNVTNESFLLSDEGDGVDPLVLAGPFPYTEGDGVQRAILR